MRTSDRPGRSSPGRRLLGLVAAATLLAASGCGSAPPQAGESGIDGLQIPTQGPRQADFVRGLDHPWFAPGARRSWTYAESDGTTRRVTVGAGEREVDGVATTALTTTTEDADGRTTTATDWYAEDRAGNVWWFGHQGGAASGPTWTAGTDGYRPGLAMAATPRNGDSYAGADRDGEPVLLSQVRALDAKVDVPAGAFETVELRVTSEPTGLDERRYYARGVGLVFAVSNVGEGESALTDGR